MALLLTKKSDSLMTRFGKLVINDPFEDNKVDISDTADRYHLQ